MLGALVGHDPLDPTSVQLPQSHDYMKTLEDGVRGLRIGFVRHFHEVDMPADPEVVAGLDRVALALRTEGADVIDVRLPALQDFAAVNRVLLQSEAWSIHCEWLRNRPGDYGCLARRRLMSGAFMGAGDYVLASRQRSVMIGEVEAALREVDILLCASSMDPACRIDEPEAIERTYMRQARTPFNVTGHPALAMPTGLSSDGLPLSVQFVARYFDEANLFRVARAWERAACTDALHPSFAE
jgi:aspartyl-tRNA(Asn)/glutamyl-tRNA(Gln) amidotransferase subunit A